MRDPIINKNLDAVTIEDIQRILQNLDTLTAYPWSPKFVLSLRRASDVKFASEAPEIVEKLCTYILYLKEANTDLQQLLALLNEPAPDKQE